MHNFKFTLAIFAFNQEDTIQNSVLSAFQQDYPFIEIILSDDCSTDSTYEKMRVLANKYSGPHCVRLNRNPTNLGLIAHVNIVNELASHDFVIAQAGDDTSAYNRVSSINLLIQSSRQRLLYLHSAASVLSFKNQALKLWTHKSAYINPSCRDILFNGASVLGATQAWDKDLFRIFGPLSYKHMNEDIALVFRSALLRATGYVSQPLVCYRECTLFCGTHKEKVEADFIWARKAFFLSLQHLRDSLRVLSIGVFILSCVVLARRIVSFAVAYSRARFSVWRNS